jgi:hypothetical protein
MKNSELRQSNDLEQFFIGLDLSEGETKRISPF